jgi:hypothetical protein
VVDNSTNCRIHMHTLPTYIAANKRGVGCLQGTTGNLQQPISLQINGVSNVYRNYGRPTAAYITANKQGVEIRTTYSSHSFTCCQTKVLLKANYGQLNMESFV